LKETKEQCITKKSSLKSPVKALINMEKMLSKIIIFRFAVNV